MKAITGDVVQYRQYASDLNELKSDKDKDGKTISGSLKKKKHDYIFGLDDLDYGQKCILFKQQYKADDTYNDDIVDYLNERDDISAGQMREILEALGATITSRNTVKWGD